MDQAGFHKRARRTGANPLLYWAARVPLEVMLKLYFRFSKPERAQIPRSGPAIIASNHRSFFDPFVIGTMANRPVYYVAKSELFRNPFVAWFISGLGAFPVERGAGDMDAIRTAKELLARGELILIFPEGTRTRPGPLAQPKRGVGRLALETGAPVIPLAIIGTEDVRKGILIRSRKICVRVGSPLEFDLQEHSSPDEAAAVTADVWRSVSLLWESLGGATAVANGEQPELAHAA
jgi:glycerol-3-phosphate dehydrogenase (NAD(P)+)